MQEHITKGHLYLSGGGNDEQSFPLDKLFFQEISLGGRFLYVPIALRGHRLYPGATQWMASVVKKHGREDVMFDTVAALRGGTPEELAAYDAVYIGGGNAWLLMKEVAQSGFDEVLREYVREGGVVYGGSAGAIILGEKIDTHDDPNNVEVENFDGLGLLGGYSVACHFKEGQRSRFQSWAEKHHSSILCLSEETGLMVKDARVTCVGINPCTIFFPDGTGRKLTPGGMFPF